MEYPHEYIPQTFDFRGFKGAYRLFRMQSSLEKRFIDVDVSQTGNDGLIKQG